MGRSHRSRQYLRIRHHESHSLTVTGDRYAGETFRRDFEERGIRYNTSEKTKHELYESLEMWVARDELGILRSLGIVLEARQ